jgi:hypothetical protein
MSEEFIPYNGYYPEQIGIMFYKNKVMGYTNSTLEAEEICDKYERTYPDIQWDFYKEKYKKYCLNPENLVTINDFFEKIKN